jgi:hypothetical protein
MHLCPVTSTFSKPAMDRNFREKCEAKIWTNERRGARVGANGTARCRWRHVGYNAERGPRSNQCPPRQWTEQRGFSTHQVSATLYTLFVTTHWVWRETSSCHDGEDSSPGPSHSDAVQYFGKDTDVWEDFAVSVFRWQHGSPKSLCPTVTQQDITTRRTWTHWRWCSFLAETSSVPSHTLKHRLRVSENRVLKRMLGLKREEVAVGWRRPHNEELHNLCASPNIIRVMRSRVGWLVM